MKLKHLLKTGILFFLLSVTCLSSCTSIKKGKSTTEDSNQSVNIPYIVAKNYFLNNSVKVLSESKISTQEQFNKLFGMATTMGKDGNPTAIDFSKQYVIAISKPSTDFNMELIPISLQKNKEDNIVFTYKAKAGEKMSYFITPCLLILVNKTYDGEIILKEIK